jgi:hypothetical protein
MGVDETEERSAPLLEGSCRRCLENASYNILARGLDRE